MEEEVFTARGLAIIARNFMDVYPYESWAENTIPNLQLGNF